MENEIVELEIKVVNVVYLENERSNSFKQAVKVREMIMLGAIRCE
ncbi:MAG: hypothetical protein ACPK7O_06785 [Methanobacterium sp.]